MKKVIFITCITAITACGGQPLPSQPSFRGAHLSAAPVPQNLTLNDDDDLMPSHGGRTVICASILRTPCTRDYRPMSCNLGTLAADGANVCLATQQLHYQACLKHLVFDLQSVTCEARAMPGN